jgi:hypothetical protein
VVSRGVSRGKLMDSPGMGIYIFLKSISVPQYQNYIGLKYFGVPRGFQGGSKEVSRGLRLGLRGKLMDSPGIGICIFLKTFSVPEYQNYISFLIQKYFGVPRDF